MDPSELLMQIESHSSYDIKSYALRGNVLSDNEKKLVNSELSRFIIFPQLESGNILSTLDVSKKTVMEIGFGNGDATVEIAKANEDVNYIAVDVYLHGVVNLLRLIDKYKLENIRVVRWDAKELIERYVPCSSIDGFHIFFPDPWPKKRHHKRRLLKSEFISLLTQKLKQNGYIYISTDWEDYKDFIMEEASRVEALELKSPLDIKDYVSRPKTRFEEKGIESGNKIYELVYIKKGP